MVDRGRMVLSIQNFIDIRASLGDYYPVMKITDFLDTPLDDDACLETVRRLRWGDTMVCPKCDRRNGFYRATTRPYYCCSCGKCLSPLAGTIFHKSTTPLSSWFYAIRLMAREPGVSAKRLQRELGVTYKTAWRISKQIGRLKGA